MNDESKVKRLEEENYRLLEVLKMTRDGAANLDIKNRELKAAADIAQAQLKILEQKYAQHESEVARLRKGREETEKSLHEVESICTAIIGEKERLVNEKQTLNEDLAAKTAEEARLLGKIHGLEAKCLRKDSEVAASAARTAALDEKFRLEEEAHEKQQQALSEERAHLEEERKKLAVDLARKVREEQAVSGKLQAASEALEALKGEKTDLEAGLEEANTRYATLRSEKERLEGEKASAIKSGEEKAAAMASMEGVQASLRAEKERLETDLEKRSEEVDALHARIREFEELSGENARRIKELESEKSHLGKDLAARVREAETLTGQLQETRETVEVLKGEKADLESGIEEANNRLRALRSEKERLEVEKASAIKFGEEKASTLASLTVIESGLQAEKERLETDLMDRTEELVARNSSIREFEELSERNARRIKDLESEKARLGKELGGKVEEWEELRGQLQETRKTLESLKGEMSELDESLEVANIRYETLRSEKERLEVEKASAVKFGEEKAAALASLEVIEAGLQSDKERLGVELAASSAEGASLKARIREFDGLFERHAHRITELESEKARLGKELVGKVKEGEELKGQLREAGRASETLKGEKTNLEAWLKEANAQYEALCCERERLNGEKAIAITFGEEKAAALSSLEVVEASLRTEKERLETDLLESSAEGVSLKARIRDFEQLTEKNGHQIRDLELEKARLGKDLAGKVKEGEEVRGQLREAGRALNTLKSEKANLEAGLEEAEARYATIRSQKEQLESEKATALTFGEEKAAALASLEVIEASLRAEKERLETDLLGSSAEGVSLKARVRELEGLFERHSHRITELESDKTRLGKDLVVRVKEGEELRGHLREANGALNTLKGEKANLEAGLREAHTRYEALRSEKERLESEKATALTFGEEKAAALASLEVIEASLRVEKERLEMDLGKRVEEAVALNARIREFQGLSERNAHQIKGLESEKARLGKELLEKAAEEVHLWEEIHGLEAKCFQKGSEVEAGMARIAELEEKLRHEAEAHEKRHHAFEEAKRYLEGEKSRLETEKSRLEGEKHRLEEERKTLILDLAGKVKDGEELRGQLQETRKALETLKVEKADLEAVLKEEKNRFTRLHSEKDQLAVEKASAINFWEEKAAALASLEVVEAGLRAEKERLETDLEQRTEEGVALNARLRDFEQLSERNAHQIKALETEKVQLTGAFEEKATEEVRLWKEVQELEAKCSRKGSEVEAGIARLAELEERLRHEAEAHEKQRQASLEEKHCLEEEKRHLEGEKARLEGERSRLQEEKHRLEEERKTLTLDLAGKVKGGEALRSQLQETFKALETLKSEKEDLKVGLEETNAQYEALRSEKERLEIEKKSAVKFGEEKGAALASLEVSEAGLQAEKERLETDLLASSAEGVSLKARIRELEQLSAKNAHRIGELDTEKAQLGMALEEKGGEEVRLWKELQGLEAKCSQKNSEVEAGRARLAELEEKLRHDAEAHEKRHQGSEEEKRRLEGERMTLALDLAAKVKETEALKGQLQGTHETLEALKGEMLELEEILDQANTRYDGVRAEKERLEIEKEAAIKFGEEKTEALEALGRVEAGLQAEKAHLETDLEKLTSDAVALNARILEFEEISEKNARQIEELEIEKVRLGKAFEEKGGEEARLWKEIQGLEAKCSQKSSEAEAGSARIAGLEERLRHEAEAHEKQHEASEEEKRHLAEEKHRLEGERETLALDLKEKIQEAEALKVRLQETGGMLEVLKGEMKDLDESLEAANIRFETLRSEKERLEIEKEAAIKFGEEKAAALASLAVLEAGLQAEKEHFETELANRTEETASLQSRIREFEESSEKNEHRIHELEAEKVRLGAAFEEKGGEEARLWEEIKGLEAKCLQQESEMEARAARAAALEAKHRDEEEAQKKWHHVSEEEKSRLVAEKHLLEEEKRLLEEERAYLEGERKTLALDLASKVKEAEALKDERVNLKESLEQANTHFEALRSEKERLEAEKQAEKERFETELANRNGETVSLQSRIREFEESSEKHEHRIKELETEKVRLGTAFEEKGGQEARLWEEIKGLEAKCLQKESEMEASAARIAELEAKYRDAEEAHEKRQRASEEEKKLLEAEKHRIEEEGAHLEGEKKTLALDLAERVKEGKELKGRLHETRETLAVLKGEMAQLKESLEQTNARFEALCSEKEGLEKEKEAAHKLNIEKSALIAKLENDKQLPEDERQRHGAEEKILEKERTRLEGERVRLEKALEDCNARAEGLTHRCAKLEGVILQTKSELDRRARMVEDLTNKVKKIEALIEERGTAQASLEEKLNREKETCAKAQAHSKQLETILRALEEKINGIG